MGQSVPPFQIVIMLGKGTDHGQGAYKPECTVPHLKFCTLTTGLGLASFYI